MIGMKRKRLAAGFVNAARDLTGWRCLAVGTALMEAGAPLVKANFESQVIGMINGPGAVMLGLGIGGMFMGLAVFMAASFVKGFIDPHSVRMPYEPGASKERNKPVTFWNDMPLYRSGTTGYWLIKAGVTAMSVGLGVMPPSLALGGTLLLGGGIASLHAGKRLVAHTRAAKHQPPNPTATPG